MFQFIFPNQPVVWLILFSVVIARYLMTTYFGFKNDFNEGDNFESRSGDAVVFRTVSPFSSIYNVASSHHHRNHRAILSLFG